VQGSLTILYEDNHCLAVNKPAPLLTQGVAEGIVSLESLVKDYLRQKHCKTGRVYLGIPHRLDRPVSGVVLFARQTKSAQRLAEQFQKRQVNKVYLAAVEGIVEPAEGVWEDWLVKLSGEARAVTATAATPGARHAILHYRRLAPIPNGTLLEMRPQTGRMHQLRVQAAVRGWPIRGDLLYGSSALLDPSMTEPRDRVIALHAHSLTFLHPIRFDPITVVAPLPVWWHDLGLATCSPLSPPGRGAGAERPDSPVLSPTASMRGPHSCADVSP
jgi:23S rRNA pseudouridine1911/1915/1917 synthase